MASYTIAQALVEYLTGQPDHTASISDCFQAVEQLTGRPHDRATVRRAKAQLGIMHRLEIISGPGGGLIGYWSLPNGLENTVTDADRQIAHQLVAVVAKADRTEFATAMNVARPRLEQIVTALAEELNGRTAEQ